VRIKCHYGNIVQVKFCSDLFSVLAVPDNLYRWVDFKLVTNYVRKGLTACVKILSVYRVKMS
jgi:hypothetical protein